MVRTNWKDIAELIGIAAIVASLVFVGVQIKQEADATKSAAVLQLKDSWVQLNLAQATSAELSEAFAQIGEQGWDTNKRAQGLVEGFYRTLFHNWSNAYYQYRIGTLDQGQWTPHLREIEITLGKGFVKEVWADWQHVFDDEFRGLVNDLISADASQDVVVEKTITNASAEIDPVSVSPELYRVLLENEDTRVVEYRIAPGQKDEWHTHPAKTMYVVSGGTLKIYLPDGEEIISEEVTGAAKWMGAVGRHYGENIGDTTVHVVLVEDR